MISPVDVLAKTNPGFCTEKTPPGVVTVGTGLVPALRQYDKAP